MESKQKEGVQHVKRQLLCTFVGERKVIDTLHGIIRYFGDSIVNGKILVLRNKNEGTCFACVYNVEGEHDIQRFGSTILMHRNRVTKTLYTINSLNKLIESLNDGVCSPDFVVPWEQYRERMLLTHGEQLEIIETELAFTKSL